MDNVTSMTQSLHPVCMSQVVGGKTVFLDAVDSDTKVKNAENHKEIIENAINKTKFGCDVTARDH